MFLSFGPVLAGVLRRGKTLQEKGAEGRKKERRVMELRERIKRARDKAARFHARGELVAEHCGLFDATATSLPRGIVDGRFQHLAEAMDEIRQMIQEAPSEAEAAKSRKELDRLGGLVAKWRKAAEEIVFEEKKPIEGFDAGGYLDRLLWCFERGAADHGKKGEGTE